MENEFRYEIKWIIILFHIIPCSSQNWSLHWIDRQIMYTYIVKNKRHLKYFLTISKFYDSLYNILRFIVHKSLGYEVCPASKWNMSSYPYVGGISVAAMSEVHANFDDMWWHLMPYCTKGPCLQTNSMLSFRKTKNVTYAQTNKSRISSKWWRCVVTHFRPEQAIISWQHLLSWCVNLVKNSF